MDLGLTDRVALVTGASKGIGLAVTETLLREGAKVVATSRKTTPELDALAGPNLVHVAADLMDPAAPSQIVASAIESFGGLDILINVAGGQPPGVELFRGTFLDIAEQDWHAMFEFNLFAVIRTIKAAIPPILERGGGAIVNVSSVNGRQPALQNVDYGSSKAALNNLTKALANEFTPQGIRVNGVSPGPVITHWWTDEGGAADMFAAQTGADRDTVMSKIVPEMTGLSTGRMGLPQEVADQIVLLVSPRSASTTGADFVVDCGFLKEI